MRSQTNTGFNGWITKESEADKPKEQQLVLISASCFENQLSKMAACAAKIV